MQLSKPELDRFVDKFSTVFLHYGASLLALGLVSWLAFISAYQWGPAWQHDYPSYHLPFMSRDLNLSTWELWPSLVPIWEGYPPLAHIIQGSVIKLTGLPYLANMISTLSVVGFFFAARAIDKELSLSWLILGLLAVPLILLNYPTGGLDILSGLGILIQLICLLAILQGDKRDILPILFVFSAGIVFNSKMNGWGITLVLSFIFTSQQLSQLKHEPYKAIATILALALCIAIWPLRNWIVMGSPIWPFQVAGLTEGGVPASSFFNPTVRPDILAQTLKPIRFIISFFELTRFATSEPMHWTFTMFHGGPKSPHQMMGGLNGALMASWVGYFLLLVYQRAIPKVAILLLICCVAVAAFLPQSHEMRYSFYVPMCLLYLNLRYGQYFYAKTYKLSLLIGLAMTVFSYDLHAATLFTSHYQLLKSHPEIKAFWASEKEQMQKADNAAKLPACINDTEGHWERADPLGIYFTGPNLNNYVVRACRPDCSLPWQDCSFEW